MSSLSSKARLAGFNRRLVLVTGRFLRGSVMFGWFSDHIAHFFHEVDILNVAAHELATLLDGLVGVFFAVYRLLELVTDGFFHQCGNVLREVIDVLFGERGVCLRNDRCDLSRRLYAGE